MIQRPQVLQAANTIITKLSGHDMYVGAHFRLGDDFFKDCARVNVQELLNTLHMNHPIL